MLLSEERATPTVPGRQPLPSVSTATLWMVVAPLGGFVAEGAKGRGRAGFGAGRAEVRGSRRKVVLQRRWGRVSIAGVEWCVEFV